MTSSGLLKSYPAFSAVHDRTAKTPMSQLVAASPSSDLAGFFHTMSPGLTVTLLPNLLLEGFEKLFPAGHSPISYLVFLHVPEYGQSAASTNAPSISTPGARNEERRFNAPGQTLASFSLAGLFPGAGVSCSPQ